MRALKFTQFNMIPTVVIQKDGTVRLTKHYSATMEDGTAWVKTEVLLNDNLATGLSGEWSQVNPPEGLIGVPEEEAIVPVSSMDSQPPVRAGEAWDDAEEKVLIAAIVHKDSLESISEGHNRSVGSIKSRLLNIKRRIQNGEFHIKGDAADSILKGIDKLNIG